jgi:hypothetical protein
MFYAQIKHLKVSTFILGSNPFSGFSHQGVQTDEDMRHFFSTARIKQILHEAETLGVNTFLARTDFHVMRMLMEHRDEGGSLQWFAQTCPEVGDHFACIQRAKNYGAVACHIHGGVMDNLYAQNKLDEIPAVIDRIHDQGMLAGVAGHNAAVIAWAEDHLDVDYLMCCYYNPIPRHKNPEHVAGTQEYYGEEDREAMTNLIAKLSRPAIHYKVLAAGRNDPAAAFAFAASKMRANDAACVGVYPKDHPNMLREDVELLEQALQPTRMVATD